MGSLESIRITILYKILLNIPPANDIPAVCIGVPSSFFPSPLLTDPPELLTCRIFRGLRLKLHVDVFNIQVNCVEFRGIQEYSHLKVGTSRSQYSPHYIIFESAYLHRKILCSLDYII